MIVTDSDYHQLSFFISNEYLSSCLSVPLFLYIFPHNSAVEYEYQSRVKKLDNSSFLSYNNNNDAGVVRVAVSFTMTGG